MGDTTKKYEIIIPIFTLFSQVFPALVARLPLKEDMEENKTIYSCLTFLYSHNPVLVKAHFHSQHAPLTAPY